jgi:hypothetical protein
VAALKRQLNLFSPQTRAHIAVDLASSQTSHNLSLLPSEILTAVLRSRLPKQLNALKERKTLGNRDSHAPLAIFYAHPP